MKQIVIFLLLVELIYGKYYANGKIELTQITENILEPVKYDLDKFNRIFKINEFNNEKKSINDWLKIHEINDNWIITFFNDVDNMIIDSKNFIGTWTFKFDENVGKLIYGYIIASRINADNIKVSCDYGKFTQVFPKVYEEYVFDQSPRSIFGLAGPRENYYAFRPRDLTKDEITLIKNRLFYQASKVIAIN